MAKAEKTAGKARTTIYFDKEVLKKLKMKAVEEEKSVSEILEEMARKKVGEKG